MNKESNVKYEWGSTVIFQEYFIFFQKKHVIGLNVKNVKHLQDVINGAPVDKVSVNILRCLRYTENWWSAGCEL